MNNVRNKVQLMGNVGKAPEIRELKSGRKMAKFSIATNESYKNAAGKWITETHWHQIIAWGKTAEKVEETISKGVGVSLEGRLISNMYVDKQGINRYFTHVQAYDIIPLVRKEQRIENVV